MSEKVISETTITCDGCKRTIAAGAFVLRVEFERRKVRPARDTWRSNRKRYRAYRRTRFHEGDLCFACTKKPVRAILKVLAK